MKDIFEKLLQNNVVVVNPKGFTFSGELEPARPIDYVVKEKYKKTKHSFSVQFNIFDVQDIKLYRNKDGTTGVTIQLYSEYLIIGRFD